MWRTKKLYPLHRQRILWTASLIALTFLFGLLFSVLNAADLRAENLREKFIQGVSIICESPSAELADVCE